MLNCSRKKNTSDTGKISCRFSSEVRGFALWIFSKPRYSVVSGALVEITEVLLETWKRRWEERRGVSAPIFTRLAPGKQIFIRKLDNKFHENSRKIPVSRSR